MYEAINPRVLLVEDSPTQMAFFRSRLEEAGFLVRTARNGAEALVALGSETAQIVVSDCDMPLVDGFQLCRLLKDQPPTRHLPVILLTGRPHRLSRFWARTCGADLFLLKEGSPEELIAAAKGLVEAANALRVEDDSGIWMPGYTEQRQPKVEDITFHLSQALEHRLLEVTVRNAVASLHERFQDLDRVAWGFLELLQDLVTPGALYLLGPGEEGYTCHLLASSGLSEEALATFMGGLEAQPFLKGKGFELKRKPILWEPKKPFALIQKHFRVPCLSNGHRCQWGMFIERETYQNYRSLFREATMEFQKLYQVLTVLRLLETANRKLKRTDEAKTSFLLTLSHDMRSPLGALLSSLECMKFRGETLPTDIQKWVQVGLTSVERLIRMVNGALDLEKMDSGGFEFQPLRVDAAILSMESIRALESLGASRQIRLVPDIQGVGDHWILVDPDRFQQALINLISNAIKFNPSPGEVRISITTANEDVVVSVIDKGPGIPEDFKEKIFGKFQQAERKGSGSGLGLSIAKRMVEHMGGQIGFESQLGEGATFFMRFKKA